MSKSTVQNVRLTAAELTGVSDDAIKLFIDDAWTEVSTKKFPENMQEKACRFLACHLAVLNNQNTKSEQIGSLKKEYSGFHSTFTDLKRTVYGQEYRRMLDEYVTSNGITLVVV
ncbi:DUF4054 domain-containing protein [Enterococcus wangshanyuanii]|uniref:DUF4054 domain-containing protein n=1 Tax=Enterococcus wangshanyuanii TaxID=2005703 RepID=A0ABQ1PJE0_9ENTE|nr:DUF4054 domain-containing protein [Enterococcus wangshanyuanii]GGC98068.1 hypothetical protein GCM10011573_29500 [Enterococcus wangshanyuanii]